MVAAAGDEGRIFRDRDKLSPRYIPATLLHREKQLASLRSFFVDVDLLLHSTTAPTRTPSLASSFKVLQIVGPVGTGKTSCVLRFGAEFEADTRKRGSSKANLRHVYVNLKLQGGSRVILYRYLLESIAPEVYSPGLSAEEMLRILLKTLADSKRYVLLSLDEIDYFLRSTKDTSIVYDLTRLNEIDPGRPCNVMGVIFIARSKEFHKRLDKAELSTLGRIALEFPSYTSDEIRSILTERAKEAFVSGVVSDEVLSYVADITVTPPVSGDLRYALDLLLYSGNLAESQGASRLIPDHVRKVHGDLNPTITDEDILNLSKKDQVLALLAVAKSLRTKNRTYASLRDIRLNYQVLREQWHLRSAEDQGEFDDNIQDLSDRGLIEIQSLKEIGLRGAPSENIETYLDSLLKRLELGMKHND